MPTSRVKIVGEETVSTSAEKASRSIRAMKSEMEKTLSPLKAMKALITGAFAVGGAVAAIRQVIAVAKELTAAYAEYERSVTQLAQSLANNMRVTAATTSNLLAYSDAVVRTIGVSDEAVRQQFSFLASMNLTEKQMVAVMDAALDLSATGLVTLEQAVLALGGSFEGNIGQLGRYVPALRDLTKEQLEAGAAVELVSRAFAGQAQIMAQTISGVQRRWKEMWGEQAEKMGQPIAEGVRQAQLALLPFLDTVGDVGLYTIVAFQRMGEGLVWWFKWSYGVFFGLMGALVETVKTAAHMLWTPIEIAFSAPIHNIKLAFIAFLNFLIDQAEGALNKLGALFMKATGGLVGKGMAGLEIPAIAAPAAPVAGKDLLTEWRKDLQGLGDRWAKYGEDMLKGLAEGLQLFRPVPNTLQKTIDAINKTGEENRAAYGEAAENMAEWLPQLGGPGFMQAPPAPPVPPMPGWVSGFGGEGFGMAPTVELGEVPALARFGQGLDRLTESFGGLGAVSSNFIATLLVGTGPIGALISLFAQTIGSLESVRAVLDPLSTVLQGMMQVLKPVIDTLLKPIIGILIILGQTIGQMLVPIFQILGPIIKLVAEIFIWLYNKALMPFGNVVIAIGNFIYNVIATVYNTIALVLNTLLGWLGVKLGYMATRALTEGRLEEISLAALETAAETAMPGTYGPSAPGSETTIQRAPDIYIYITVEGSVYGPGGLRQVGGEMAQALQEFAGIGGRIHIEEAIMPIAG